jgi:hypothetical protein
MAGPIRLGIAPIGWTNDDLPELGGDITLEQCLREARLASLIRMRKIQETGGHGDPDRVHLTPEESVTVLRGGHEEHLASDSVVLPVD